MLPVKLIPSCSWAQPREMRFILLGGSLRVSFTAPHNPAQNEFLCITHTDCVTMVTTVLLQQLEMLQGISDHHQLGSATWTEGNSRRLKEAEGPEISIFGAL